MKKISTFIAILLLTSSCGNEEQIQTDSIEKDETNIPKLYLRPTPFDKKLKGAVIIASLKGDVSVINLFQSNESDKNNAEPEILKAGEIVLQGSTIVSGKNSEVDLLFSNGTSAKIGPDSKLTINAIWQKSFQESAKKVSDIKEETSPTRIDLDLEIGDLIVDVKKLKKESSFRVNSPLGVAGIRGTQFRIFCESKKVELSVLEGEVSFWDQSNGEKEILNSEKLILETNINPILKSLNTQEKRTIKDRIISVKKSTETYDLSNLANMLGAKAKPAKIEEPIENKEVLQRVVEQHSQEKKRLNSEIASLKKNFKKEKTLRGNERKSAALQIQVLENNVGKLEREKQDILERRLAEMDNLLETHRREMQKIRNEINRADAAGYKRGIDEMLARQR